MADKITISAADVNSDAVDEKLKQIAAGRSDQGPGSAEVGGFQWSQLIYNTLVYSTLFGLIGGLAAGLCGELYWVAMPSSFEEYAQYRMAHDELIGEFNSGEITEDDFDQRVADLDAEYAGNEWVDVENDPTISLNETLEQFDLLKTRDGIRSLLCIIFWFATVGMLLAFCLSIADQAMGHNLRGVMVNGSVALALALAGTFFGACIASVAYNKLGGGEEENFVMQVFARAIGWGLFGGFLAVAPGIVLKNWKRLIIGLVGGLIGGTLGGALFDPISVATNNAVVSRVVAIIVIGTLTGLGTGLLETAAKTGWVRVIHGLIAGKQFILYKDTTYIGSSPQCEIYLFKDPSISPRHAAIHKRGSAFELEDLRSATSTYVNGAPVSRTRIKKGDQIQIGATVLMFLEKSRS